MEISDQDFQTRVAVVLAKELAQPEQWHYLSFADEVFRGAVVIKAHGVVDALGRLNQLGQNPGGEILCVAIPDDKVPEERFCNRLLTRAEVVEAWGEEAKSLDEWEVEEQESQQ